MAKIPQDGGDNASGVPQGTSRDAAGPVGTYKADDAVIGEFLGIITGSSDDLPVSFISIIPDGSVDQRDFKLPQQKKRAIEWLAAENVDGKNIYWTVNGVKPGKKKASKLDITFVRGHWGDFDPTGNREQWRLGMSSMKDKLIEYKPTLIIDSGNGIQAFWLYLEQWSFTPTTESIAGVEKINQRCLAILGDGGKTFNIDRIMRVPGTLNWPSAAKLKAGYSKEPVMSSILYKGSRVADTFAAGLSQPVVPDLPMTVSGTAPGPDGADGQTDAGDGGGDYKELDGVKARDINTLKGLFSDLLKVDTVRDRYLGSRDGLNDTSGSGMDMSMVSHMKGHSLNWRECAMLLADWPHGSQAGRVGSREDRDYHWKRCWARSQVEEVETAKSILHSGRTIKYDRNAGPPHPIWCVTGMLSDGIQIAFGQPGAGKTSVFLPLSAIIAGLVPKENCGALYPLIHHKVLYMAEDMRQAHSTLDAMVMNGYIQATDEQIADRILIKQASRLEPDAMRKMILEANEHLVGEHRGVIVPPAIVADTLNANFELENENDNAGVGRMISAIKETMLDGGAFFGLAHVKKIRAGATEEEIHDAGSRGAGAFKGDASGDGYVWIDATTGKRYFTLSQKNRNSHQDEGVSELELPLRMYRREAYPDAYGYMRTNVGIYAAPIVSDVDARRAETEKALDLNTRNKNTSDNARESWRNVALLIGFFLESEAKYSRFYTKNSVATDPIAFKLSTEDCKVSSSLITKAVEYWLNPSEDVDGPKLIQIKPPKVGSSKSYVSLWPDAKPLPDGAERAK